MSTANVAEQKEGTHTSAGAIAGGVVGGLVCFQHHTRLHFRSAAPCSDWLFSSVCFQLVSSASFPNVGLLKHRSTGGHLSFSA